MNHPHRVTAVSSIVALVALVASSFLAVSAPAAAQVRVPDPPRFSASAQREAWNDATTPADRVLLGTRPPPSALRSIDVESHWAKGLYIASVASLVSGAAMAVVSFAWWLGSGLSAIFTHDGYDDPFAGPEALAVSAAIVGGFGLLTLPIAIGLDVDSGLRRDGLARDFSARVSVSPGGLGLTGTF